MACPCGYKPGPGQMEMSTYFIKDKKGGSEFIHISCNSCNRSVIYWTIKELLRHKVQTAIPPCESTPCESTLDF